MPASSAFSVGPLNAFWSVIATAMPSTLPVIAVFMALTISAVSAFSEPVHWNCVLSRALASSAPYWVGTKNGFVVTWLTNTKRYLGVFGKSPAPASPSLAAFSLDLPHAASAATRAAPPPASAARREISRRERASGAPSRSVKGFLRGRRGGARRVRPPRRQRHRHGARVRRRKRRADAGRMAREPRSAARPPGRRHEGRPSRGRAQADHTGRDRPRPAREHRAAPRAGRRLPAA